MNAVAIVTNDGITLSLPDDLPFDRWVKMGRKLCASSQVINWHIGDWWAFGEKAYGERAKVAAAGVFGLSFQSLAHYGTVARAFEPCRRLQVLSFSHHQEVAALPREQADELLARAEADRLSTRDLRREVNALRTSATNDRRRDVIDIRPQIDIPTPDKLTRDEQIVELATELSKMRALNDPESGWLENALYRLARDGVRLTEEWGGEQDVELIALLQEGRRPPVIAPMIGRTEGAVWRRIHKLGGISNLIRNGSGEEWPIRRV